MFTLSLVPALPAAAELTAPTGGMTSMARPQTVTTGTNQPSNLSSLANHNRAQVLGNRVSGDGTRYFSVTDRNLAGIKDPKVIAQKLCPPPIVAGDGVRRIEIEIEVRAPLFLAVPMGQEVRIGTVSVDPGVRDIQVNSRIYMPKLQVVGK